MATVYRTYYHFPHLDFDAPASTFAAAWAAAFGAVGVGSLAAVLRAARVAPAAALAAPRPASFRSSDGVFGRLAARLDAKSRIILRRIMRFPRRSATTIIGVGLAIGLLVVARTFPAVMDRLLDVHFSEANRQDVSLSFAEARSASVLNAIERLPGVLYAEPVRIDSIILRHSARRVEEALIGMPPSARLNHAIGQAGESIAAPPSGLALARALATKLEAAPGDAIEIEQTRGRRTRAVVRVASIVDPMVGAPAYMDIDLQAGMFGEFRQITGANIRLDMAAYDAFNRQIKETPGLAGASFMNLAEQSMRRSFAEGVGYMNLIYAAFAAIMAGGVAFSAARVTLAEQERDLATLRVIGFTRTEVSYVLAGELAVLALASVPLGCVVGTLMAQWLMALFKTDMYAFPYVFNPGGYAFAVLYTLGCVAAAALIVRTGVDRLDMVGVLKSRD
jgi:putative ABC transport system permease protein